MKTKLFEGFKKFTAWIVIIQMVLAFLPVTPTYAEKPTLPSTDDKVMICHQKGNGDYNSISISVNSADPSGGHGADPDDIIPAFYYDGVQYDGVNWPELSYIWLNNCNDGNTATLSVVYDGNGNDGGTEPFDGVLYDSGATVTVMGNSGLLTKTGTDFTGWNTMANGSGVHYDPGDTFTITNNTILYAEWSVETFLVNFITDGGSPTPDNQTIAYGGYVSKPSDPAKTGYTFGGWYDDAALTNLWLFNSDTVLGDMTLYAKWIVNEYDVFFDTDGGLPNVTPQSVAYGDYVTEPADPSLTGYTYDGWYQDNITFLLPWDFANNTMPAHDVYLYAKWDINRYTVTTDVNGSGFVSDGGEYNFGSRVELLATPSLGWHFVNWSGDCGGVIEAYEIMAIDHDYSCTANFEINTYDVFFNSNKGTPVPPYQTVEYGDTVFDPGATFLAGHTFDAWCDITLADPWSFATDTVTEDMTLYARYTTNEYTVDFDSIGGTAVPSVQVLYEEEVPKPSDPAKIGNTFEGWYVDPDCTTLWDFDSDVVTDDMTLYACWSVNEYTIDFDSAGGTPVASITQDYDTVVTAPADPTRTGYSFTGWTPAVPATMPAYDQTLTAGWNINQYTITFDTDGGNYIAPITQDYDTAVVAPANPTKTGYTFTGWDIPVPALMPAHDLTLTAEWRINEYTVTFDSNGGTPAPDPQSVDYGNKVTEPTNPARTGYTFICWALVEDLAEANVTMVSEPDCWDFGSDIVTDDMELIAVWQINQYTIDFDSNGGTPVASITQDYNTVVTAPADPTRTGYKFDGWDIPVPVTMPAQNLTLTASWIVNQYTIYFNSAGGTPVDSITQDYGTVVTAPVDPTRTGYTFVGWTPAVPAIMPAYDQTLVASWIANSYIVSFDANGGFPTPPNQSVDYGDYVTEPTVPTRDGYSFVCWVPTNIQADSSVTSEPTDFCWNFVEYAVKGDTNLQATWQINQYTITFDSNGGSLVSPITKNFGEVVETPTNPTRSGYTFTGWTPAVPVTMPAYDQTLVAGWSLIPVTPPTVLTPPVALAAPAAPAAPAVAGATDEPETVAQDEGVQGATDEPVQGSSDKTCPWWWIIGLILIASLAFTGGVVRAEKDESRIRKYWYVWPPVLGGIAWVAHYYLHKGFSATWFCDNYWLVVLVLVLLAEIIYRFLVRQKSEDR